MRVLKRREQFQISRLSQNDSSDQKLKKSCQCRKDCHQQKTTQTNNNTPSGKKGKLCKKPKSLLARRL